MNWGHKIIIVYVIFVAGMLFLAYKSSTQNIELVTPDYYAKELVYQQKIDQAGRAALLSAPVDIKLTDQKLIIIFPKDFASKNITGDVVLYCPSDEKRDMHQQFAVTDSAVNINLRGEYKGLHYIKINWMAGGISYYFERKIII